MLRFNELRIDSQNNLIVDVEMNQVSFDPSGLSGVSDIQIGFGSDSTFVINYDADTIKHSPLFECYQSDGHLRRIKGIIPLNDQTYNNELIYVHVDIESEIVDIPCSFKQSIEDYTYNKCLLYSKVFDYIKQTMNLCYDIDAYANYIVQIKGLELAIESGNFFLANKYWNKFFINTPVLQTSNCGCNG